MPRTRKQSKLVETGNTLVDSMEIVTISKGPKELVELLDLINLLPRDQNEYMKKTSEIYGGFVRSGDYPACEHDYFQKYLRFIGPKLAKHVSRETFLDARTKVSGWFSERMVLIMILRVFNTWENEYGRRSDLMPAFLGDLPIGINFNPDTSLRISKLNILRVLLRPIRISKKKSIPLPIERVRLCPICLRFHWARRLDAETCGEVNCANTLGNQKRRKPKKSATNDPADALTAINKETEDDL